MLNHGDIAYNEYCKSHPNILEGLNLAQVEQFRKYMNEELQRTLTTLKAREDGAVVLNGVEPGWETGALGACFITNLGVAKYEELQKFFPNKHSIIKQVFANTHSELEYVAYLVREHQTDEWDAQNEPDKEEVFSSDYEASSFYVCRQFYKANLPIPMSLVGVYEKAHKYVYKDLKLRKFYSQAGDIDYTLFVSKGVKLFDMINDQVVDGTIPTEGTQELAVLAWRLSTAIMKITTLGMTAESLANVPIMWVYKTNGANGLRYATQREMASLPVQTSQVEMMIFKNQSHFEMLLTFCWFVTGNDKYLDKVTKFNKTRLSELKQQFTIQVLDAVISYILSPSFQKDVDEAKEYKARFIYPTSAEDEIIGVPFTEKAQKIYDENLAFLRNSGIPMQKCRTNKNTSFQYTLYSIAREYLNGKRLSSKQMSLISKSYEQLTSQTNRETYGNVYSEEVEKKIKACKTWFNYPAKGFYSEMMSRVQKNKRCSPKQLEYIDEEYNKYLQEKELTDLTAQSRPATLPSQSSTGKAQQGLSAQQTASQPANQPAQPQAIPDVPTFNQSQPFSFDNYEWEED